MSVPYATFREQVLVALERAKTARPSAHLHLLYTPELHDPVPEAGDSRRDAARIRIPSHIAAIRPSDDGLPRLITLDTRRVAPYLLEHDAALDDPLLEASIDQAHAEAALGARADAHLDNADPELAAGAVGGWIVSDESATQMAQRIASFSAGWVADEGHRPRQRQWMRWTQPQVLCSLWPLLSPEQRAALVGTGVWVAFDVAGRVRAFTAADGSDHTPRPAELDAAQSAVLRNIPLVQELLAAWSQLAQDRGRGLPADAEHRLHLHLQEAQRLELPGSEVPVYALTAASLLAAATQSPQWQALLERARDLGPPFTLHLQQLPQDFWQRWLPEVGHQLTQSTTGTPA